MGKSARRRKEQARARRRQQGLQSARASSARATVDRVMAEVQQNIDATVDPATPPEEAARALLAIYGDSLPPAGMPLLLEAGVGGRAAAVAAEVARIAPGSLAAVSLAGRLAEDDEDWERAISLYRGALETTPETAPDGTWPEDGESVRSELLQRVAGCLLEQDRVADALDAAFEACRDDPGLVDAQQALAAALLAAWSRRDLAPSARCSCGSGLDFGSCCRRREEAALARFEDRSPMYELRDGLRGFLDRPDIEPYVVEGVRRWYLDRLPSEVGDPGEEEARIAIERALLTMGPGDDDSTLLDAFADEPATPASLARRAREWRRFARFGLWEVSSTRADPGLLLQDLVSGELVFTAVAPEQLERLPRWSVLISGHKPLADALDAKAGTLVGLHAVAAGIVASAAHRLEGANREVGIAVIIGLVVGGAFALRGFQIQSYNRQPSPRSLWSHATLEPEEIRFEFLSARFRALEENRMKLDAKAGSIAHSLEVLAGVGSTVALTAFVELIA